jgi:hypothetical protein
MFGTRIISGPRRSAAIVHQNTRGRSANAEGADMEALGRWPHLVVGVSWDSLTGRTANSTEITVTDTAASEKTKFYRVQITLP